MHQVDLKDAETRLSALIDEVASGEEVIITRSDGACFKIVSLNVAKPVPKFGSAKGQVKLAEDFDAPIEGFEDYMP